MKSMTSYFNGAIIREDLRRLWGLSGLYFLMLFLVGPFDIGMNIGKPTSYSYYEVLVKNFLDIRLMEIQLLFSIILAIVLAMLLFKYLHTIRSTTMIHALPITRKELFISHNIAAFILMAVPVILNALALIILMVVYNDGSRLYTEIFTLGAIFRWVGITMLLNISIYMIATFAGMVTGITLVQGILSLIFLYLPFGLGSLILVNLDQLVYGFAANHSAIEQFLLDLIPLTAIIDDSDMGVGHIVWYIILIVALFIASLYLYNKRHLEKATDPISYDILKPVFKYGFTFCVMVLGGAYFYTIKSTNLFLYMGYALGGFLGYIIGEMIIQKSIWIHKRLRGFIIYALVVTVLFIGIELDLTGFEKRIPGLDSIESAYYGYGLYGYRDGRETGLKEEDNIKLIIKLHEHLVENKKEYSNFDNTVTRRSIGIAYELKNGKTMYREYMVPFEFIEDSVLVKYIYESEEYKKNYYDIFKIDPSDVNYVEISPNFINNKKVQVIDDGEIKELLEALRKDILEETYEENNSVISEWADVVIFTTEKETENSHQQPMEYRYGLYIPWKKHYDNFTQWLKEKGYYENARLLPDEVDYILLDKNEEADREIPEPKGRNRGENGIEIRDEEIIEEILQNFISHYKNSEDVYAVSVYLKNRGSFTGWIETDRLPEEFRINLVK